NGHDQPDDLLWFTRSVSKVLSQRSPADVTHHEIAIARFLAKIIQREQIRMFQARDNFGLAVEQDLTFDIFCPPARDDFDSYQAVDVRIPGRPDLGKPAFANLLGETVNADHAARRDIKLV